MMPLLNLKLIYKQCSLTLRWSATTRKNQWWSSRQARPNVYTPNNFPLISVRQSLSSKLAPVTCAKQKENLFISAIVTIRLPHAKKNSVLIVLPSSTKTILSTTFRRMMCGGALTSEKFAGAKIAAWPEKSPTVHSKWTLIPQFTAIWRIEWEDKVNKSRTKVSKRVWGAFWKKNSRNWLTSTASLSTKWIQTTTN